ncbi:hypothetical protein Q3G72_033185 [Acer saccharum]|nr:hypothetical protein Q3G72_033185 [Acer saccharum]
MEAKKEAIEGPKTKFGSWLRASPSEKVKLKSSSQGSGGTSGQERSSDDVNETDNRGTHTLDLSPPALCKGGSESSATTAPDTVVEKSLEDPTVKEKVGADRLDSMCVDGPPNGPSDEIRGELLLGPDPIRAEQSIALGLSLPGSERKREKMEEGSARGIEKDETSASGDKGLVGREGDSRQFTSGSPPPQDSCPLDRPPGGSKRKEAFDPLEDDRVSKKGKPSDDNASLLTCPRTAEPAEQARREP